MADAEDLDACDPSEAPPIHVSMTPASRDSSDEGLCTCTARFAIESLFSCTCSCYHQCI